MRKAREGNVELTFKNQSLKKENHEELAIKINNEDDSIKRVNLLYKLYFQVNQ